MFRQSPAFAVTAVLALGIGIGANTAIFSVVNAVILQPVPFPEAERLVQLVLTENGAPASFVRSPAAYMHLRDETEVIEDVAAYRNVSVNYAGRDALDRVAASEVTASYFGTFRAPIELGRAFTADEDMPGAAKTALVGHDFWRRRLGGDARIVGATLTLNGIPHTIVGVVAPEFDTREFGRVDVWTPLQLDPATTDQGSYVHVAARLKAGVSLEQAQARLDVSTAAFRERFPVALRERVRFGAVPFEDAVVGAGSVNDVLGVGVRSRLWILLGAVALVLLIACANVASLMLVRASRRRHEIAIRSAVGAGQWRIVRQLLTEGALLCAVGAALGLALGFLGMRALLSIDTAGLPRLGEAGTLVSLDWRVLAFTAALSILTCVLFSLVPALVASRTDPSSALKYSSSRSGGGFRQGRAGSILVVIEVGLAVVLLIGAALLIRTSLALDRVDPGFNVDDILVIRTDLSGPRFTTRDAMADLSSGTLDRIRAIPGVETATASCCVPLIPSYGLVFNIIGRDDEGPFTGGGDISESTGRYFETFQIPVLRGRVFDERDDSNSAPVVVINRTLAERFWPEGEEPIGDSMLIGGGGALYPQLADEPVREIIGIVDDTRALRLTDAPRPIMYLPLAQFWRPNGLGDNMLAWIVRTSVDPMRVAATVRDEIRQATGVPATDVRPMTAILSDSLSRQQANMLLMAVFGGAALLLAAIGLYGLIAYAVQQRFHEIGLRMALGAQPGRVRNMVVRQGALLVAFGTVIGLAVASASADVLASVLFGVEPHDPAAFLGVPLVLTLVALVAVAIPAWRASRVDPFTALRCE